MHSCTQWRAHEKEQLEEENRKILEFAQQQEAREETRKVVKKQQEDAIAAVYDKLSNQITEKRAQDEEMERYVCVCMLVRQQPTLLCAELDTHEFEYWMLFDDTTCLLPSLFSYRGLAEEHGIVM